MSNPSTPFSQLEQIWHVLFVTFYKLYWKNYFFANTRSSENIIGPANISNRNQTAKRDKTVCCFKLVNLGPKIIPSLLIMTFCYINIQIYKLEYACLSRTNMFSNLPTCWPGRAYFACRQTQWALFSLKKHSHSLTNTYNDFDVSKLIFIQRDTPITLYLFCKCNLFWFLSFYFDMILLTLL